jgi:hypothetical protein
MTDACVVIIPLLACLAAETSITSRAQDLVTYCHFVVFVFYNTGQYSNFLVTFYGIRTHCPMRYQSVTHARKSQVEAIAHVRQCWQRPLRQMIHGMVRSKVIAVLLKGFPRICQLCASKGIGAPWYASSLQTPVERRCKDKSDIVAEIVSPCQTYLVIGAQKE